MNGSMFILNINYTIFFFFKCIHNMKYLKFLIQFQIIISPSKIKFLMLYGSVRLIMDKYGFFEI